MHIFITHSKNDMEKEGFVWLSMIILNWCIEFEKEKLYLPIREQKKMDITDNMGKKRGHGVL